MSLFNFDCCWRELCSIFVSLFRRPINKWNNGWTLMVCRNAMISIINRACVFLHLSFLKHGVNVRWLTWLESYKIWSPKQNTKPIFSALIAVGLQFNRWNIIVSIIVVYRYETILNEYLVREKWHQRLD